MAAKIFLGLSLLRSLASPFTCPTYTCDSNLSSNFCATYTAGNSIKLNANGCQTGYYCSSIATTYWGSKTVGDSHVVLFACMNSTLEGSSTKFAPMNCGTKLANKRFKNDASVIYCTSDSDCLLADGTFMSCRCVLRTDSVGVCQANLSNDLIFGEYWKDCGASNTITDEATAAYWTFYPQYWAYIQSNVECMHIFQETTMLNNLSNAYSEPTATPGGTTTPGNVTGEEGNSTTSTKNSGTLTAVMGIFGLLILH